MRKTFFPVSPEVCLHDAVMEEIAETGHSATFTFRYQENMDFEPVEQGHSLSQKLVVKIEGCCAQELSCYLVHRYGAFHHAFRVSKGIALEKLQKMLQSGNTLELIDELYAENQFYWKLSVKPCKRHGLSDEVELSASGVCRIQYEWTSN